MIEWICHNHNIWRRVRVIKEENSEKIEPSYAGLFWFNDDYTAIDDLVGVREFSSSDIRMKKKVVPLGNHSEYFPQPNYKPRGRVMLINGEVHIYVGEICPDSAIAFIEEVMRLTPYKDFIKVTRHYHWNATWEGRKWWLTLLLPAVSDLPSTIG